MVNDPDVSHWTGRELRHTFGPRAAQPRSYSQPIQDWVRLGEGNYN